MYLSVQATRESDTTGPLCRTWRGTASKGLELDGSRLRLRVGPVSGSGTAAGGERLGQEI